MTHDFSVPMCCMECGSVRKRAGTKWVHIQQFVWDFPVEMDTCQFGVHHDHSTYIKVMDWAHRRTPQISESPEIINCQENQILIFNICPTNSYHLSFDQNFEWCPQKKKSKGLGGGIFVSLPKPKSYTQLQHKE